MATTSTIANVTYTRISHHFKFNYSQTNQIPKGQFISSPIFNALGHDWIIDFYPKGSLESYTNENISFFVRPQGESQILGPSFTFGLKRIDGSMFEFEVPVSPSQDCKYGLANMIRRISLETNYIKDGCFEFVCSVNSMDEAKASIEAFCVVKNNEFKPINKPYTNSTAVKYIRVSHHFNFDSKVKYLAHGEFISSPVFKALGHEWVVDCYARGTLSCVDNSRVLFYVRRLHGEPVYISPYFTFGLMRDKKIMEFSVPRTPTVGYGYGCSTIKSFIPTDFALNGYLEFICGVNNIDETEMSNEASKNCLIGSPPFNLHCQMGEMLENKEMSDVIFEVGEHTFVAHKFILAARSPVFKAELFGQTTEAEEKHIKISDIKADVFRAMLSYIYTDLLPNNDETNNNPRATSTLMVKELYAAADKYALEGLKMLLEEQLCKKITVETVETTLSFAEKYGSCKLKDACFEFINKPRELEI